MALEDLEGVGKPDVTGGRPKKQDDKDIDKTASGTPYTENCGADFWIGKWQEFHRGNADIETIAMDIAHDTHTQTRTCVRLLHEYEAHDMEQYDKEEWDRWLNPEEIYDTTEMDEVAEQASEIGSGLEALISN